MAVDGGDGGDTEVANGKEQIVEADHGLVIRVRAVVVSIFEPVEIASSTEGIATPCDDAGTDLMLLGSLTPAKD
jgi:hypothetical protein